MKVLYGKGELEVSNNIKAFDISYSGAINITNKPSNLLINATHKRIIGINIDKSKLNGVLFSYEGEFKIKNIILVNDLNEKIKPTIEVIGLDSWSMDNHVWEDDTSLWDEKAYNYISKKRVKFDKKNMVVNSAISVEYDGQYKDKDGNNLLKGDSINIHADGTTMTNTEDKNDSIQVFNTRTVSNTRSVNLGYN